MPANDNFIKPKLPPKPQLPTKPRLLPKSELDEFARPLTKIIDAKKNKIEIFPKIEISINETKLSEQPTKMFPNIDKAKKETQDYEKYEQEVKNQT